MGRFNNGIIYTIADKGKILNATYFGKTVAQFGVNLKKELNYEMKKEKKRYSNLF